MMDDLFNPFPGLRSFELDEDHLFFGRERQIDELLARLRRTRFLAVVGTSGSGKSSLVRSGLIPSLYSGFMTQAGSSWRVAVFRPGDDPIGNLAAALNVPDVLGGEDDEVADMNRALLETTLRRSTRGLAEVVRQARLPAGENLLVLADQFEELFRFKQNLTIKDSRDSAVAFVKVLLEAAAQQEVPVYVILTMRSDFIGNCTEFAGLAEAINDGQYLVPRMDREEQRSAIAGPVAVGGAEIAPRLVQRLLNDVGDDPDQLPTLQHALMRTWDYWQEHQRDGEVLDLRHYEAIGTMAEALSRHAEEAYRELEGADRQRVAEKMFKALTDKGSDSRGVRRPIRLQEVCELTGAEEAEVIAVVDRFRQPGRSFLTPPAEVPLSADSILDVSHESLMRVWTRLLEWVDEEAQAAQTYRRLSLAAGRYQEGQAALWRDPELQLALRWKENNQPTAVWAQRYEPAFERAMLFLETSRQEREREIARKDRRQKRRLRRTRQIAYASFAFFIASLVWGLFTLTWKQDAEQAAYDADQEREKAMRLKRRMEQQRDEADAQRELAQNAEWEAQTAERVAQDLRLAALASMELAHQQEQEAKRLKAEAVIKAEQAVEARRRADEDRRRAEESRQQAEESRQQAEESRQQAETSERESERLRRLEVARRLAIKVPDLLLDGDGELAALIAVESYRLSLEHGGSPRQPEIHDALQRSLRALGEGDERRRHDDAVRALAVSRDGRALVSGSEDGSIRLWDLDPLSPRPLQVEHHTRSPVRALAMRGDGRLVAAGRLDGTIDLMDFDRPEPYVTSLAGHAAAVHALVFSPARDLLVSASADGTLRAWTTEPPAADRLLAELPGIRLYAAAVSPDGDTLASGGSDGVVRLWRLSDDAAVAQRELEVEGEVRSLAFSGDSAHLAAGTSQGAILVWEVARPAVLRPEVPSVRLSGHMSSVNSLVFLAGVEMLASGSSDNEVRLWSFREPDREPVVLADHTSWVWTVAASPDGVTVISGSADRTLRLWDTRTQSLAERVCSRLEQNMTREQWRTYLSADLPYRETCPLSPSDVRQGSRDIQ